ncbi:hypothetical protein GOBAR_AA34482 [Gossypium barbadense]|uniref:Tr-type G domain-containing protein n=1 Tax=Gossypium barbadense TaxID=3634 RepID=A0A2P5W547_GOSBA|nr:hypothetical protein GOBAR_AA34482 [Gossypium barbadense]
MHCGLNTLQDTCLRYRVLFCAIDTKTGRKRHLSAVFIGNVGTYMAHIIDTNEEERAKGITIEVGRAHFETETTRFTILDAPGHKGYIPNRSTALLKLLSVISARKGEI